MGHIRSVCSVYVWLRWQKEDGGDENLTMTISEWLNLAALIVIPILAVLLGRWLQNRAERRKDKMQIFKALMTSRIYGWTRESVECLNIIDIVFAKDKAVRAAWKDLNDKYHVDKPDQQHLEKIRQSQYKLLEAISKSLGYKKVITWQEIQNVYIPDGLIIQIEDQNRYNQNMLAAVENVNKMFVNSQANQSK